MGALPLSSPLRTAAPHPALASYVQSYIQIRDHPAAELEVAAIPSPLLLVTWNAPVRIVTSAPGERALPLVALAGLTSRVHRSVVGAGACGFHLRLSPTGARALLGERLQPDTWEGGLPPDVQRWAEAIAEAPTFEARVALADAFWRARIPSSRVWSADATRMLARTAGSASVTDVASVLGVSARTLRRRFTDDVGLGVKLFGQIERYRQAHGLLLRSPGTSWTDICARFGYADQAHFVRAFRRFSGGTPTRWSPDEHGFDIGFGLRGEGARPRRDRFVQDHEPETPVA